MSLHQEHNYREREREERERERERERVLHNCGGSTGAVDSILLTELSLCQRAGHTRLMCKEYRKRKRRRKMDPCGVPPLMSKSYLYLQNSQIRRCIWRIHPAGLQQLLVCWPPELVLLPEEVFVPDVYASEESEQLLQLHPLVQWMRTIAYSWPFSVSIMENK